MHEKGLSEAALARQTSIPQPTLHKILSGKTSDPRISTLQLLADFFKITVDELMSQKGLAKFFDDQPLPITQSIPIISWVDCIGSQTRINKLTPSNWNNWLVIEKTTVSTYGLISKPSMEARFPKGTVLVIDTDTQLEDGDLVVVHYKNTREATLRELSIDGPTKLLIPVNPNLSADKHEENTQILGVVTQSRFSFEKKE